MSKIMTNKELCKSLDVIAASYKEIMPDDKNESVSIKWGVEVMKQSKKAIRQGEKAIELLKEFAFFCVDESIKEHCDQAAKVQEFLKTTYAKEWVDKQLGEMILDYINTMEFVDDDADGENCTSVKVVDNKTNREMLHKIGFDDAYLEKQGLIEKGYINVAPIAFKYCNWWDGDYFTDR